MAVAKTFRLPEDLVERLVAESDASGETLTAVATRRLQTSYDAERDIKKTLDRPKAYGPTPRRGASKHATSPLPFRKGLSVVGFDPVTGEEIWR